MPRQEKDEFLAAAANCDVPRVSELLRHGADVNQVNNRGRTALHVAAAATTDVDVEAAGPFKIVDMLIQHGADVNALDSDRRTPLCLAIPRRQTPAHYDVIELLLKSGARIDSTRDTDESPVYLAVFYDKPQILRALFKHNIYASVGATSPTTQLTSPMHRAAELNRVECLKVLVENGFDPELQIGFEMMTPVHAAIRRVGMGHVCLPYVKDRCLETLRAMLEVNVNFETPCYGRDYHRRVQDQATTPFEYALYYDRLNVAQFLADVVSVNIQSIRRICRERGIRATSPREDDEPVPERTPDESAKREKLLSLLRKAASPWSLRSLCRSVVRRRLGRRIKDVNELDIPNAFKDFITFNYDFAS